MNADAAVIKQISRAGRRRTVAQPLRTWDASRESLRNFTGKAHRRVTALALQFHLLRCIVTGSLRRLWRCIGGGFRFPPPPMSEEGESLRKTITNEKEESNDDNSNIEKYKTSTQCVFATSWRSGIFHGTWGSTQYTHC